MKLSAEAFAPTNIALTKYWGKRGLENNLPATSSISYSLDKFGSQTKVVFDASFEEDAFFLNDKKQIDLKKQKRVLNELRKIARVDLFARIESKNNFPTNAGLASSASGLAALTLASAKALEIDLSLERLSSISRLGSGSSCRSFYSGYVEWVAGEKEDDSIATPLATKNEFPLSSFIFVVSADEKHKSSTDAMESTRLTSPYYSAWLSQAKKDFALARRAILTKDFESLSRVAQHNCAAMHACAMSAFPPIVYWKTETIRIINAVFHLQQEGHRVFFTVDAGPNVVCFFDPSEEQFLTDRLSKLARSIGGVNELC
ncbi:MAG: diphosphomevalonate decarboxylase [Bacteriovoracia bacterium]